MDSVAYSLTCALLSVGVMRIAYPSMMIPPATPQESAAVYMLGKKLAGIPE